MQYLKICLDRAIYVNQLGPGQPKVGRSPCLWLLQVDCKFLQAAQILTAEASKLKMVLVVDTQPLWGREAA